MDDPGIPTPLLPACPNCQFGNGRRLEAASLTHGVDSFICVVCAHFWTAPLTSTPAALKLVDHDPRR
jgi:hypothetical protein